MDYGLFAKETFVDLGKKRKRKTFFPISIFMTVCSHHRSKLAFA